MIISYYIFIYKTNVHEGLSKEGGGAKMEQKAKRSKWYGYDATGLTMPLMMKSRIILSLDFR
jgi:hypothetical protein